MNSKMSLIVSMLILIASSFLPRGASSEGIQSGPSLSVRMGFLGESSGNGTYSTKALSVSVGAGSPGFQGMVFVNDTSVATAVGSAGTSLIGPSGQGANTRVFESSICVSTSDGLCPMNSSD